MTTLQCDACSNIFDSSRFEPKNAQTLCPDCNEDKDRENQQHTNGEMK